MEAQENDSKRLDDTISWIISIYGQLDDRAKMEAGQLFPEIKEINTLSPFERALLELSNMCARNGKLLTAASARYAAKRFLPLATEQAKKETIEKACRWMNEYYNADRQCYFVQEDIAAFKKAMKE